MRTLQLVCQIAFFASILGACSPNPVDIEFDKERYLLEGADSSTRIVANAVDSEGNPIKEGVDLTFFCPNRDIVQVTNDGRITAVSSGEDKIEVEVVGTDIKKEIEVRVKIPAKIAVTHEKLRLWTGQVKKNVAAWVESEKDAYIEGYLPEWSSDDPSIVSVEGIKDTSGTDYERSYVKMTGEKSGTTTINATFKNLMKSITVRVYNEDEEVDLSGHRIPAEGEEKEK